MNWAELKDNFLNQMPKTFKSPHVRASAFKAIEKNMEKYFPEIISNPSLILAIDRKKFKRQMAKCKETGKLNSAEDSVINGFYKILK
jgi:hypothetical protein